MDKAGFSVSKNDKKVIQVGEEGAIKVFQSDGETVATKIGDAEIACKHVDGVTNAAAVTCDRVAGTYSVALQHSAREDHHCCLAMKQQPQRQDCSACVYWWLSVR